MKTRTAALTALSAGALSALALLLLAAALPDDPSMTDQITMAAMVQNQVCLSITADPLPTTQHARGRSAAC